MMSFVAQLSVALGKLDFFSKIQVSIAIFMQKCYWNRSPDG